MSKPKLLRTIFTATLLSILVFLSVSFITVLTQINPLHYYKKHEPYKLEIGFPFEYYHQFWVSGSTIPNSGWTINNFFYDCLITWAVVTGVYILIKQTKNNSQ
jgi:hypothetical protein